MSNERWITRPPTEEEVADDDRCDATIEYFDGSIGREFISGYVVRMFWGKGSAPHAWYIAWAPARLCYVPPKPERPPLLCWECGKPGVVVSMIDGRGYYWTCDGPEPCWIGADGSTEAEAYDKAAKVLQAPARVKELEARWEKLKAWLSADDTDYYDLNADDVFDKMRELEDNDAPKP